MVYAITMVFIHIFPLIKLFFQVIILKYLLFNFILKNMVINLKVILIIFFSFELVIRLYHI